MEMEMETKSANKKLEIVVHEGHPQIRTFIMHGEDYTFTNILTYMLQRFPETLFCGYTIGHPADNAIKLRLKVKQGFTPEETFQKAMNEIKFCLVVVKEKFENALNNEVAGSVCS